jgi:hypothetical protein
MTSTGPPDPSRATPDFHESRGRGVSDGLWRDVSDGLWRDVLEGPTSVVVRDEAQPVAVIRAVLQNRPVPAGPFKARSLDALFSVSGSAISAPASEST